MNIHTHNPIRIAIAAALFALLAAGAHAADVPEVHVKYADINVNNAAGAKVLYQRIRAAADQVCGVSDMRELARLSQAKTCAAQAVADAVATVNASALTAVYKAKTGGTPVTRLAAIR